MVDKLNKNLIAVGIGVAGLFIAGAIVYVNLPEGEALSSQEAAEKAIAFINQNIQENVTASLLDVVEESGVYKISLQIEESKYESFITKDGNILFSSGFDLSGLQQEELKEEPKEESEPEANAPALDDFAKCLTDKGMKFYGSKNCGWCQKQKELFGDSLQYLVYIECIDPQTEEWSEKCKEAGIDAIPVWEFADGERIPGFKELEALSELSGCELQ